MRRSRRRARSITNFSAPPTISARRRFSRKSRCRREAACFCTTKIAVAFGARLPRGDEIDDVGGFHALGLLRLRHVLAADGDFLLDDFRERLPCGSVSRRKACAADGGCRGRGARRGLRCCASLPAKRRRPRWRKAPPCEWPDRRHRAAGIRGLRAIARRDVGVTAQDAESERATRWPARRRRRKAAPCPDCGAHIDLLPRSIRLSRWWKILRGWAHS